MSIGEVGLLHRIYMMRYSRRWCVHSMAVESKMSMIKRMIQYMFVDILATSENHAIVFGVEPQSRFIITCMRPSTKRDVTQSALASFKGFHQRQSISIKSSRARYSIIERFKNSKC